MKKVVVLILVSFILITSQVAGIGIVSKVLWKPYETIAERFLKVKRRRKIKAKSIYPEWIGNEQTGEE